MWIIPSSCFLQLLFVLFISIFSSLPASYRSTVLPFTPSPFPVYHNLYLPPPLSILRGTILLPPPFSFPLLVFPIPSFHPDFFLFLSSPSNPLRHLHQAFLLPPFLCSSPFSPFNFFLLSSPSHSFLSSSSLYFASSILHFILLSFLIPAFPPFL